MTNRRLLAALVLVACPFLAGLRAQCAAAWLPGEALLGTDARIYASTHWDPDGAGPLGPLLVVAGDFTLLGSVACQRVAAQDPATGAWAPIGNGFNQSVYALQAMPNGDLIAGGRFTAADGTAQSDGVARWNGSSWVPLGQGLVPSTPFDPATVSSLALLPNGDLIVGGQFRIASGVSFLRNLARFDANGSGWSTIGTLSSGSSVAALAVQANGDLVVGGSFTSVDGVAAANIAQWNVFSWSSLGSGVDSTVLALAPMANGALVAGGAFVTAGGGAAAGVALWDGTTWSAIGSGVTNGGSRGFVHALLPIPGGAFFAGGIFDSAGGVPASRIALWDGTSWQPQSTGVGAPTTNSPHRVSTLSLLGTGSLLVGGDFDRAGTIAGDLGGLALLGAGGIWSSFHQGIGDEVVVVQTLANGDVLLGGKFQTVGGVAASRVARWNGSTYAPLGGGVDGDVAYATELANGDIVVAGTFANAGGISAPGLARWDGVAWSALGSAPLVSVQDPAEILALAALPNGDLVVAGRFDSIGGVPASNVARWNGTAWSGLGTGLIGSFASTRAYGLAVLPSGDLVVGGSFHTAGGVAAHRVARWDGAAWHSLGVIPAPYVAYVFRLHVRPGGDLVVSGDGTAPFVASWNGATWSLLAGGVAPIRIARAFASLPDGDLVASGFATTNSYLLGGLGRWNGTSWSLLAEDVGYGVRSLAVAPSGELVAAGGSWFLRNGDVASAYLGRLGSTCPASTSVFGSGCTGSGGANTLTAINLPWVDATFRAEGTGLPTTAIVLALTSLTSFPQGAVPLSVVFAQAGSSCDVLTAPDILGFGVTTTGTALSELFLPNTPPLVGVTFFHQLVPIEFDAQGNWIAVTATNALQLTAGML